MHSSINLADPDSVAAAIQKGSIGLNQVYLPNGCGVIHEAIRIRAPEVIKRLQTLGADLNLRNAEGDPPLHFAIMKGQLEVARLLIQMGANKCLLNNKQRSPLHLAIEHRYTYLVESLLDPQLLDQADIDGNTPLHMALKYHMDDVAVYLIEHGAKVSAHNNLGTTFLHLAAENACINSVRLLLSQSDDLNHVDLQGKTALHHALEKHSYNKNLKEQIALMLIQQNCDITLKDNQGRTAFLYAAISEYTDVLKALLSRGANINQSDIHKDSALHCALNYEREAAAKLLIASGAEVNQINEKQQTPLHIAILRGCTQSVKDLINKGAAINMADSEGETPLHYAAATGSAAIVESLIQYRADLIAQNNKQLTALHIAASGKSKQCFELIVYAYIVQEKFETIRKIAQTDTMTRSRLSDFMIESNCSIINNGEYICSDDRESFSDEENETYNQISALPKQIKEDLIGKILAPSLAEAENSFKWLPYYQQQLSEMSASQNSNHKADEKWPNNSWCKLS